MYNYEDLTKVVTGREPTMFLGDIRRNVDSIRSYKSALFIGGAGTIGLATIKAFMEWGALERIGIVDQDENAMAEAIRSVRNRSLAVGLDVMVGDVTAKGWWGSVAWDKYDLVLWFAAMKHVRSERDLAGCKRMMAVNFEAAEALIRPGARYFYCSTDKAADPVSLLGASKFMGEAVAIMCGGTSARFANVAFSNGSLLQSWLYRMAEAHPLPVPRGVRRYLISPAEAGRICLLAATWSEPGVVLAPLMGEQTLLEDARKRFADHFGYHSFTLTEPDTAGEKDAEKFCGDSEQWLPAGLELVRVVPAEPASLCTDYWCMRSKDELLAAVAGDVPHFRHLETGKSLDGRA